MERGASWASPLTVVLDFWLTIFGVSLDFIFSHLNEFVDNMQYACPLVFRPIPCLTLESFGLDYLYLPVFDSPIPYSHSLFSRLFLPLMVNRSRAPISVTLRQQEATVTSVMRADVTCS